VTRSALISLDLGNGAVFAKRKNGMMRDKNRYFFKMCL